MKKILIVASLIIIFSVVPHALAQTASTGNGFVPLAPIPGLTDSNTTSVVSQNSFAAFFNDLYKYLIGLSAVIAIIMIIWGGLEISTKDSVSSHSDGKHRIQEALFGLVLVLSPVIVFSIINPSILNLSIPFQKLDLTVTPLPGTSSTLYSAGSAPPASLAGSNIEYQCVNNDCTASIKSCSASAASQNTTTLINKPACVTSSGAADSAVSVTQDPSTNCPAGETKAVICSFPSAAQSSQVGI